MRFPILAALAACLALTAGPAEAQVQNNPIPGIDVVVLPPCFYTGRRPCTYPGSNPIATTNDRGAFTIRGTLPVGEYAVTPICGERTLCEGVGFADVTFQGRRMEPGRDGFYAFSLRRPTEVVITGLAVTLTDCLVTSYSQCPQRSAGEARDRAPLAEGGGETRDLNAAIGEISSTRLEEQPGGPAADEAREPER